MIYHSNKIKFFFFIFSISCLSVITYGQAIIGMSSKWNDSYVSWNIHDDDSDNIGSLELNSAIPKDWSSWQYSIYDISGIVRQSVKGNPNRWDIRGENKIITISTSWNNHFDDWLITDNSISLKLRRESNSNGYIWTIEDRKLGNFSFQTINQRFPTDWEILDEFDEKISASMKIAILFAAIYTDCPHQ
jgi:hypothetical protein